MSFFNNPSTPWNTLEEDSKQFTKPTQYPDNFQYTDELEDAIRGILRLYAINKNIQVLNPQLRLYVENKGCDTQHYFNSKTAIQPNESIQDWGRRIFEGKRYILIIDCIERFSDRFSSHFAKLITPYLEGLSSEEVSYRITLFIGNSGYTPFGAHVDLTGLDVTHFHLGPGKKSMILWEKNQFQKLSNSEEKNCYEFEKYLPHAKRYELQKGDVLFFPTDKYYHIGEYHEFSIATAVGVLKESPGSFYKKAMSIWNKDIQESILSKINDSAQMSDQIPENIRNTTVIEIIEDYKRKKESNLFMHNRPVLKKLVSIFLIGKGIQLIVPFKIVLSPENEVYSRGRKLDFALDNDSKLITKQLNKGDIIICNKEMTKDTLDFITWLFNTGSVVFAKTT